MPSILPPLASPEDLAVKTGVAADDPALMLAMKRASDRFRGEVRHAVTEVTGDTVILDGTGSTSLFLPSVPVIAVRTVTVDGAEVTDYQVSTSGMLRRKTGWPDGLGNVTVTYDHGYVEIPGDIQDAVLEQAELMLTVTPGVTQASVGGKSVSYGAQATVGVTQRWVDAVEAHRINLGDRP